MKLSIVTSFFNCGRYIDQMADSVLSQTYGNWEWIICDDFSTDDTMEKVVQLAKRDPRIILVTPKYKKEIWWNPQTYATGDIVCPIDGDDVILPKTFEKIVHYFNFFSDAVLMHFNANKYQDEIPSHKPDMLGNFVDNVYISRDNNSFLEGFQRLSPERTGIFGYLRIFRNIPGLRFKVHDDSKDCSSNDGQWLLNLEETGKWVTIPRTTYLARQHFDSENFRNWNMRGEVKLIQEAVERRREMDLEQPRSIDFFDEIYEAAEATYISELNWESESKNIGFINFNYNERQIEKIKLLFFEHNVHSVADEDLDYVFIRINPFDTKETFIQLLSDNSFKGKVSFFCDNVHLHHNNRTGVNNLEVIREYLMSKGPMYYNYQNNRASFVMIGDTNETAITTRANSMKKENSTTDDFAGILIKGYDESPLSFKEKRKKGTMVEFSYFSKPKVDVKCEDGVKVNVKFIKESDDSVMYQTELGNNMFAQLNREYHEDFRIEAFDGSETKIIRPDFRGKKVYIHIDSSSLGDTIAWFPYVDEFRKKHRCSVVCSTFNNDFFEKAYPEIGFVKPGTTVHGLYKMFTIGWFYNNEEMNFERNPCNFRDQNLQKTASDILGLEFEEIRPKLDFTPQERPYEEKYVCIANHSTAQAKYWNNPEGWQETVDWLKLMGYRVVLLSKEPDNYMGNRNPAGVDKISDKSLKEIMNYLWHSELFIGLGSGLSWVSWALGKKTVLISGFSRPNCEMSDCIRIFTPEPYNTCNGCFNDFKLDAGDWNWCPRHKGTSRQFECTKKLGALHVIERIKGCLD